MDFYTWYKNKREKDGYTFRMLEGEIDMERNQIANIYSGKIPPSHRFCEKIEKATNGKVTAAETMTFFYNNLRSKKTDK